MAIYLVQHGRSFTKEEDPERRLTDEGAGEVTRIAGVAKNYGVRPAAIRHSGIARARETAEIMAAALDVGDVGPLSGMAPNDDAAAFGRGIDCASGVMYVGHLPFMERLASALITGSVERPLFRFQNGGIVCIDRHPDAGTPVIVWALMPRVG